MNRNPNPSSPRVTAPRGEQGHGGVTEDTGAILLMVLLFMVGVALIIGSLLTVTSTAEIATSAHNTAHADDYAIDGGMEYGIDEIRNPSNPNWCTGVTSATILLNGSPVNITCHATSGSITRISNWALATYDPGGMSLSTQSGARSPIQVLGPTYIAGGMKLQSQIEIDARCSTNGFPTGCTGPDGKGNIYQHAPDCTTATATSLNPQSTSNQINRENGLWQWSCTTYVPSTDPAPPSTVPGLPLPPAITGSCTILYPGKYTKTGGLDSYLMPSLNDQNSVYLVSGVYYFDNVGTIDLGNNSSKASTIFGGVPSSGEVKEINGTPCASDPPGWNQGTGVEIVLGGNSAIDTDKGGMELYSYTPPGGLRQPSLVSVPGPVPTASLGQPAAWPLSWDPSTIDGAPILYTSSGNQPNVAIHGLVYTPNGSVSLFGTNNSVGEILGGVMAWDVSLQKSASASNFDIATSISPITSVANLTASTVYGGKTITVSAQVVYHNSDGSITINSWTINNP